MSYQVLARKWRPQTFTDVVGQAPVLKVLMHSLSQQKVHHAYLFSGTRGVGKTSIARLLARGLNCEQGITASPCGVCDCCRDITQGRFIDLIEIDAASRTKVEDTREILDNVQYLPTRGHFKVYLIDEVHMLSRSSFNALLKTLEEPPEYVKFLLATTDPQKLPVTILSRCLHLHLSPISEVQIGEQLKHILHVEKIIYQSKGIQLLAKAARGSMRDALSLTDQAIALGKGEIDTESVATMLGVLDDNTSFMLMEALIQADGNALMEQLAQVARQGNCFETVLNETLALLHQIALVQLVPTAIGDYLCQEERLRYFAQILLPQDIQLYYQILLEGKASLVALEDKKMATEMIFLRALAFHPKVFQIRQEEVKSAKQPVAMVVPVAAPSKAVSVPAVPIESSTNPDRATESDLPTTTRQLLKAREKLNMEGIMKPKKLETLSVRKKPLIAAKNKSGILTSQDEYRWQSTLASTGSESASLTLKELRHEVEYEKNPALLEKLNNEVAAQDNWAAFIEKMTLKPILKQLAIHSFLEEKGDGQIVLHLRSLQGHLNTAAHSVALRDNLCEVGKKVDQVTIVIDDNRMHSTPFELREQLYQKKLIEAKKILQQDEKVALLCEYFDAQIDEECIRPV